MKRFLSAFLIFAAILITGCSDSSAFGKLTLKIDSKTASKIEQAAVSRKLYNETEILLDINILGDYTASKTVAVQDGTKVEFYDIPAGAQVYAEATARLAGDRENTPLLHGTSEKIIIHEEENFITLELQKTEQQIEQKKYRIEVMQSQNGTVTPDCTEAEAGTTVKLTVSPEENYQLVSYQVKNESNGQEVPVTGESFIMPEGDVKVYAYFEQVQGQTTLLDQIFTEGTEIVIKTLMETTYTLNPEMTFICTGTEFTFENPGDFACEGTTLTKENDGTLLLDVKCYDDETDPDYRYTITFDFAELTYSLTPGSYFESWGTVTLKSIAINGVEYIDKLTNNGF